MKKCLLSLLLCVSLTGCIKMNYPEFRQGNVLEITQIERLRTGMSKSVVHGILGTPALVPVLDIDRWDYYYGYKPDNNSKELQEEKLLSLYFNKNSLTSYSGSYDLKHLHRKSEK